jgi:hypothetical protein
VNEKWVKLLVLRKSYSLLSVYFERFLGTIERVVEIGLFCWKVGVIKGQFDILYDYEFTWTALCRTIEHKFSHLAY